MKKLCKMLCVVLVLAMAMSYAVFAADAPKVTASAAIVMDYDTGEVLYSKDIDTKRVPASMTKIMTAYIMYQEMEKGSFTKDSLFFISDSAWSKSRDSYNYPASVPLVGDTIDVDTLLKLIMLPSASASCIVAAENISGSEAAFVERMNSTAAEMGIDATYYNSHGAQNNYVSARAIATLIRNFIRQYPDILNYTSLKSVTYDGTTYTNTNKLLSTYYYEGVDGFKTGTLSSAGYCLSATGTRDGRRIITVVMNSSSTANRHLDSQKLLDYGFAVVAERDASRQQAQVSITSDPLRVGVDSPVKAVFSNISAPFYGTATLYVDGVNIGSYTGTIADGTEITGTINLDKSYFGTDSIGASVTMTMPTGGDRTFDGTLSVSDLEPPVFSDIFGNWAEGDVTGLYNMGLIEGYDDGTFRPEEFITRAEFVTTIAKAFKDDIYIPSYITITFPDIKGHWAEDQIEDMASAKIVFGYEDDTFRPDEYITRQEVVTILYRVLDLDPVADVSMYTDSGDIADWAVEPIGSITAAGILEGYPDGTFLPESNMTRAETMSLIYRIIK